jgi:hypothetical protein
MILQAIPQHQKVVTCGRRKETKTICWFYGTNKNLDFVKECMII